MPKLDLPNVPTIRQPIEITPEDRTTVLWGKLREHYNARLAILRNIVEDVDMPEDKRKVAVVRVNEIKLFMDLGNPTWTGPRIGQQGPENGNLGDLPDIGDEP